MASAFALKDAVKWAEYYAPAHADSIAVCPRTGEIAVGGVEEVTIFYLPGAEPRARHAGWPGTQFSVSLQVRDVRDVLVVSPYPHRMALAFRDEHSRSPFNLLAAGPETGWIHQVNTETGESKPAFRVDGYPAAIASSGSLVVVAGPSIKAGTGGVYAHWLVLFSDETGAWVRLSSTPTNTLDRIATAFFCNDRTAVSVSMPMGHTNVGTAYIGPGGKLEGYHERRAWEWDLSPVAPSAARGMFCIPLFFNPQATHKCVITELDEHNAVVGVLPTTIGDNPRLAAFAGPSSGIVVYDSTTGALQVFASVDTVAQSLMSHMRVAWMIGVARSIQRRFPGLSTHP